MTQLSRPPSSTPLLTLLLLILAGLGANPLQGQIRFGGLEGWVGFGGWEGDDVDRLRTGVLGGGTLLFDLTPAWTLGLEGRIGRSDFGFADEASLSIRTADVDEVGVGVVARRYLVARSDGPRPFAQLTGGWSRLESDRLGVTNSQTGFAIGPEVGLLLPTGGAVDFLMAGGFTWNSYDEHQIFGVEAPGFGDSASGLRWALRIGLSIGTPR